MTSRRSELRAEWERISTVNDVLERAIDQIAADDEDAIGKAVAWSNAATDWIDDWRDRAQVAGYFFRDRIETVEEWRHTYGAHRRALRRLQQRIQRHRVQRDLDLLIADAAAAGRRAASAFEVHA